MIPLFDQVAVSFCNGCMIGHGSQQQHNVCTMDWDSFVPYIFDDVLMDLDEELITNYVLGKRHGEGGAFVKIKYGGNSFGNWSYGSLE